MGYTHYFPSRRAFTKAEWEPILANTLKLLKPSIVVLEEANQDEIRFNGRPPDDDNETFLITRKKYPGYNFCKTANKPYDEFVVAVLCLCQHFAPGALAITSDGDPDEWRPGLATACEATGQQIRNPIRPRKNHA